MNDNNDVPLRKHFVEGLMDTAQRLHNEYTGAHA